MFRRFFVRRMYTHCLNETPCSSRRWNVPHSRTYLQKPDWLAPASLARYRVQNRGRINQESSHDEQVESHCFPQEAFDCQERETSREGWLFCPEGKIRVCEQEQEGALHPWQNPQTS